MTDTTLNHVLDLTNAVQKFAAIENIRADRLVIALPPAEFHSLRMRVLSDRRALQGLINDRASAVNSDVRMEVNGIRFQPAKSST